ncbi:LamG domain-containing protein, partial [Patescibacteria group bacterium]|nr:LamG domain-containing protein [Patescibacteria group bacterium]
TPATNCYCQSSIQGTLASGTGITLLGTHPDLGPGGSSSSSCDPNGTLLSGLVGYWKMDETEGSWDGTAGEAVDSSGVGNHGTSYGGANTVPGKSSEFGNAGSFNGSSDYVNCGNDASLQITGTITIQAWIKPMNLVDSSHYGIVRMQENVGSYLNAYAFTTDWKNNIRFYKALYNDVFNKNVGFENDTWYHVATTHTFSTGETKLFYDGRLVRSEFFSTYVPTYQNNYPLRIADGQWGKFNGLIDDVRIYNRVLSPEEISSLYRNDGDGCIP